MHDDDTYESPGPTARSVPNFAEYASFVELSRSDPTAFAMMVMQQSNDRTVSMLEHLLMSSVARVDRVLGTQISNSHHINEALQTLTQGASEVVHLGVDFFSKGLHNRARVARMKHETELGKERTELLRDTVEQGSLLMQAVLMGRASAPPPSAPSSADAEIEAKARRVLELVDDDVLDSLREVAPSLPRVFEALRAQPVTANRVRAVLREVQTVVDPAELGLASQQFEPELAHAFGTLVMRVLSEDRL